MIRPSEVIKKLGEIRCVALVEIIGWLALVVLLECIGIARVEPL
jgi:hypothetical protein